MMVIIIMIIFLHGKTSCFFGALKLWKVHTPFLKEVGYVNDSEFPFFLSKNFMHSLFLLMSEKQKILSSVKDVHFWWHSGTHKFVGAAK